MALPIGDFSPTVRNDSKRKFMKTKIIFVALLLIFTNLAKPAFAGPLGDRFHLGISAGYGIGHLTDTTSVDGTEDFSTLSWMLHAGVRFTPSLQARLSLGIDDYMDLSSSSDTGASSYYDEGMLAVGDIDLLWHPLKGRLPLLDPYLLAGFGYPRLVHAGFGADVSLGGIFAVFGEALYGTAFADHNGLARIGIKIKL